MRKNTKYEIIIYWSNEDNTYIADVPELSSCMAHGNTYYEALKSIEEAIDLWLETAEENDLPIPTPKGRRLMYA
jgi:predicted RNase H-like HicB family nuclease